MNSKEFINYLSNRTGLGSRETVSLTATAVSAIVNELADGNSVTVPSFGIFEVKKKLERVLVNPTTKQRMLVPPKMVVNFKPNTSLRSKIKNEEP